MHTAVTPESLSADTAAEASRLRALEHLRVLDSAPEPIFDSLVRIASEICGTPIALLSLIDRHRQWFKSSVGMAGVHETPRSIAFCDHTIRADTLFVVQNAVQDTRFADNPLVTGTPDIRFYAGAPLVMTSGERVGTLCVIDRTERALTPQQSLVLQQLAAAAVQALEMRRHMIERAMAAVEAHERASSDTQLHLRAMLDVQADFVGQSAPDGTLLYANPAYAASFGLSTTTIVGTSLFDYVHPADRATVRARIDWVLETGQTLVTDNRMRCPSGAERWIEWSNARQLCADGTVLLHSTGRDVTARVQTDNALRASRALLARTGKVAGVGGWSLDIASGSLSWSDETRRLHEVAADFEPTLQNAIAFYSPCARPRIEQAVQRALDTGQSWDLQLQLVTARGRPIWARAVGEVELEDGKPVRLVGSFQDITEQHALQTRLADNERFLRQMTDSLPVRIAYLDRERRYRFVNDAWCRVAQIDRQAAIGRTRAELFPQLEDHVLGDRARAVLAGVAQCFEYEEVVSGGTRRFENRLVPDVADNGDVVGFFVTSIDVTERSQAELASRQIAGIFDNSTDYVLQADMSGNVLYMNQAARRVLGVAADAGVGGQHVRALMPPLAWRTYLKRVKPALQATAVWVGQSAITLASGRCQPVSAMVIAHRNAEGRVERCSALLRDVSEEIAAQQEMLRQTLTLRSVADAIPATVAVVDAQGCYSFVNRAFANTHKLPAHDIVGRPLRSVFSAEEIQRIGPAMDQALRGEQVILELEHAEPGGRRHLALECIPLRRPSGEPDGFVVITQDVTQRKREEARLRALSLTDRLTGLLNRAGFEQLLSHAQDEKSGQRAAIFYIDLDRFKTVNDTHGHAAGDDLLRQVGQRLMRLVRPSDGIARLGGDEFAILLPGMQQREHAKRLARQVVKACGQPFALECGATVSIGASVGAALGSVEHGAWERLLAHADRLLYRAKNAGRGCFVVELAEATTA